MKASLAGAQTAISVSSAAWKPSAWIGAMSELLGFSGIAVAHRLALLARSAMMLSCDSMPKSESWDGRRSHAWIQATGTTPSDLIWIQASGGSATPSAMRAAWSGTGVAAQARPQSNMCPCAQSWMPFLATRGAKKPYAL
eukprot:scaffold53619_cov63-Phaeocystis_antarctica.AAC.4